MAISPKILGVEQYPFTCGLDLLKKKVMISLQCSFSIPCSFLFPIILYCISDAFQSVTFMFPDELNI